MPRVSVIMPAHDAEPFLTEAIESVRRQTYTDWEIVAVDDGSSDATWTVLQNAGPRVRALRKAKAEGPAAARNLALEHAGGELVVFLDADDLLLSRYLESQVACYEAACRGSVHDIDCKAVGLVTCDARILIAGEYASYTHLQLVDEPGAPITLERLLRRNPIHVASLVPAAVGGEVGWFDRELYGTEDLGLWLKILEAGYGAILNQEVLAVYRRVPGTVSSNLVSQGENNRRAYELALARGRLSARQRRIAKRSIRYNRAMKEVARLRFAGAASSGTGAGSAARSPAGRLARLHLLLLLAWVALSNPHHWLGWLALLRSGRAKDAAELRASP
jgi:glycosyltransferase involved in cell wall biosynthesis